MERKEISKSVLKRLPGYLNYLKNIPDHASPNISATALAAALGIDGHEGVAVFSVGSDGTDGPTDAAGGYADGDTLAELQEQGISLFEVLADNDAYHALQKVDGLIITGPTGTNVNDVAVALLG